jgi:hypothetical protein
MRAPRPRRARPAVEVLEDRCTPATFTVTTAADVVDAADGVLSLREAVAQANATSAVDTIVFGSQVQARAVALTQGHVQITGDLTIQGAYGGTQVIQGDGSDRLFDVAAGATARLANLTLTGGRAAFGAGLTSSGTLTLSACTVRDNTATATDQGGGGLYVAGGTATLTACTFSGNAADRGGALHVAGGSVTATNCTFYGNTAATTGGAILQPAGALTLDRCTITGNTAGRAGGGLSSYVPWGPYGIATNLVDFSMTRSIVAGNVVNTDGFHYTSDMVFYAAQATNAPQFAYNLVGLVEGVPQDATANQIGVTDPRLGALAENGGPTQTCAPLSGSPALDAAGADDGTLWDQRGPGYFRARGAAADVGAVEAGQPATTGTVQAISVGGLLLLTAAGGPGGTADQAVRLTTTAAGVRVVGLHGTTVTGATTFQNVTGVRYAGTAGHDWLFLDGLQIPGTVTVQGGNGANGTYVTGPALLAGLTVTTGTGADAVVLADAATVGGAVTVNQGAGDSTFQIGAAGTDRVTVTGAVTVTAGQGYDRVLLNGGGTVRLGAVTVQNGGGGSLVQLGVNATDTTAIDGALRVTSADGFDQLLAGGAALDLGGSLAVQAGNGGSRTRLISTAVNVGGGVTVTAQAGDDTFDLGAAGRTFAVTGAVTATLGDGANTVSMSADRGFVGGMLTLTAQGSANAVTLGQLQVAGATALNLGQAANTVAIDGGTFGGAFTYTGGGGQDRVAIATQDASRETTFLGPVAIALGGGDDQLTIGAAGGQAAWALFLQGATLDGGGGQDTVTYLSGRANRFGRPAVLRGWETVG